MRGASCINVKERVHKNHKYGLDGQQESSKNRQCLLHDLAILPSMKFFWKLGSNTGSNTVFLQTNFFCRWLQIWFMKKHIFLHKFHCVELFYIYGLRKRLSWEIYKIKHTQLHKDASEILTALSIMVMSDMLLFRLLLFSCHLSAR